MQQTSPKCLNGRNLLLDKIPISAHNILFLQENYSLQCSNMLPQVATNVFIAWKSNQHLHHLPLSTKNTKAGITSTQGASNYLTTGILDPCRDSTQGD